jgi:hypothetical protein
MLLKKVISKSICFRLSLAAVVYFAAIFASTANAATELVHGHQKKNGKFVQSHTRSKANNTQRDNWSSKGNTNPRTGKHVRKSIKK